LNETNFPATSSFLFFENKPDGQTWDPDRLIQSARGSYDSECRCYAFNLTAYAEQLITGRIPNQGFSLMPVEFVSSFRRVVLASRNHPTLRPRLRIFYSKLKD
jgi:hypothetical protein